MEIGVIGCGAIGSVLCKFIDKKLKDSKLVAICDIDKAKTERLKKTLKNKPIITDIEGVIKSSEMVGEGMSLIGGPCFRSLSIVSGLAMILSEPSANLSSISFKSFTSRPIS